MPAPNAVLATPGQSIDSDAVAVVPGPLVTGNVVQRYVDDAPAVW